MVNKVIKYADLFCGLGSFHIAFDKHNKNEKNMIKYECVFACDINDKIRNIYEENFKIKPEGDINNLNLKLLPDFDLLCAGFPCQPFSIAGKKKGFSDKEKGGDLFTKILEIIDIKKPSQLFLENVKNLKTVQNGSIFKFIISELEKRNFNVTYEIIDSKYYNCPQSRQRLYIICNKKKDPYIFKNINYPIVPVSTIIDHDISDFINFKEKYSLEINENKNSMIKFKLVNKKTGKGGRQGERVYDINNYGPTICSSSGGVGAKTGLYYFNGNIRTLTVKETLKMFGFDESYKYRSLSKEKEMLSFLGNSIVVNVLEQLIKNL